MKRDPLFPSPRDEVDRLFDALIHTAWGSRPVRSGWSPPVDVSEEADGYRLEMDLPGVRIADVSITAEGGQLRIGGVRERARVVSAERRHLAERRCGRFARTFRLPPDADVEGIRARLSEGILTVTIPKKG